MRTATLYTSSTRWFRSRKKSQAMRGNITRRGKASWRVKFDLDRDPVSGKRQTRYVTVRGKRQDAERELARLLNEAHNGTLVEPSKLTVAEYMRARVEHWHAS